MLGAAARRVSEEGCKVGFCARRDASCMTDGHKMCDFCPKNYRFLWKNACHPLFLRKRVW